MNKIRDSFIGLAICCSFFNCTNEGKNFHLAQADAIMHQYNEGRSDWDKGIRLEGEVNITATKYLTTIDVVPDSSHEVFSFFLQSENNETNLLSVAPGKAEVLYLDRHIIVNSLVTPRILYFKVKTEKKPAYLEDLKNLKEYTGYGIGMRKVAKGNTLESAPFCSCIAIGSQGWNCSADNGENGLSCGTSNNIGGCKISCSGQTIACCDSRAN